MTRTISGLVLLLLAPAAAAAEPKVSFRNEVLPLLARQGCSSASCHGSPRGQGGLQLSLWGLDPESDHANLTQKDGGRRIKESNGKILLLAKPSRAVEHKGGLRLPDDSAAYAVVRKWIEEGYLDDAAAPRCKTLEVRRASVDGPVVTPTLTMRVADPPLKLAVFAIYPDGSKRDVSHLAVFTSSNENLAAVTVDGQVTPWSRGLVAINVRFQHELASIYLTVQEDARDFVWSAPKPANFIDDLVYAQLKELQILPAKLCTDEEFLRRVHLDVVGSLPEVDQVRAFLANPKPDKRARLIDDLLARPEHAKFWAQRWGDFLQITQKTMGRAPALAYANWLQEAWAKNLPYDQFASELLLARGDTAKEPRANFFRMGSDHSETMEAASIIFLGAQIQCAKCHNHPSKKWTQFDYHGMRNFFSRVMVAAQKDSAMVNLGAAMEVKLPDSQKVVPPWLPGVGKIDLKQDDDPRVHLVRWLTSKDNAYFAAAEANRMWALLMGRGIVEPFDDIRATNPPSNPPLLAALAREFVEHQFDRRHLLRTILQSNTYQASARPAQPAQDNPATALRDSFEKVVKPFLATHCVSCHGAKNPDGDLNLEALGGTFQKEEDRKIWQKVLEQTMRGAMPPKRKAQPAPDERRGFLLTLRGGVKQHGEDDKPYFARYQPRRLTAEQLLDAIAHVTGVPEQFPNLPPGTRATHLPIPDLNPHEFLQTFGQPQRSNTCSCDRPVDANLGEALAIYNGKAVNDRLKNPNNRFRKAIKEKKSGAEIVDLLFLAAYCRTPRPEEATAAERYISARKNREQAFEDLCWALMTTSEFLSQH